MLKKLDINLLDKGTGWVLVFPRGKHFIDKYGFVLNCDDKFFKSIADWWENSTFKKPYLDKSHEFDARFGDFTQYRVTEEGLEMFLVLNDKGKELVKSGDYEYLSPMFKDAVDSTGKSFNNVIFSVSLVNYPALLALDKIQDQIALSVKDKEIKLGGPGMEFKTLVARMLKLNMAAEDGSILAEIERLLNEGATIEELKTKIEELKSQLAAVEGEKKVVEEEKKTVDQELSALKKKSIEAEGIALIDQAIKDGQYPPSLKEMKMELFMIAPESVKKELSLIPKGRVEGQKTLPGLGGIELSVEDKKILEDAGYDLSKLEDVKLGLSALGIKEEVK